MQTAWMSNDGGYRTEMTLEQTSQGHVVVVRTDNPALVPEDVSPAYATRDEADALAETIRLTSGMHWTPMHELGVMWG